MFPFCACISLLWASANASVYLCVGKLFFLRASDIMRESQILCRDCSTNNPEILTGSAGRFSSQPEALQNRRILIFRANPFLFCRIIEEWSFYSSTASLARTSTKPFILSTNVSVSKTRSLKPCMSVDILRSINYLSWATSATLPLCWFINI